MSKKQVIIAETPRLILRYFCENDWEDLAAILGNPEVMKYSLAGVLTKDRTRNFLKKMLDHQREGYSYYAVIHRKNKQLIGYCGLLLCSIARQEEVEIGYRLDPNYWGRGLATEAAIAVRDYAFENLALNRLISLIQPENMASIKVAEKIGMEYEKDYIFMGMSVKIYRIFKQSN